MDQESKVPVQSGSREAGHRGMGEWYPFGAIRREIDRMFDDLWRFPYSQSPNIASSLPSLTAPAVDVVEKPTEFQIVAELPGLEEKNIEVKCADGVLTVKGEKRDEKEEQDKDYFLSERRFGSFQRSFRLPQSVDADKIEAVFKNGLLTLTLPKKAEAQKNEKKIAVKGG
jgi:HSP20 family protein